MKMCVYTKKSSNINEDGIVIMNIIDFLTKP